MRGKCYVIGAGDITVGELQVEEEDYVIAADGGLAYCDFLGLAPDVIIGDFDSLGEQEHQAVQKLKREVPQCIVELPTEKDDTDMLAALKYGMEQGYTDFRIYGGTGGRLEHTLANIQCLMYLKNRGATGYLMDGAGMILVLKDEAVHFRKEMEGMLSLFSLSRTAKGVSIRGMKYPLDHYTMTNDFPIGVSNEFIGQEASIQVEEGELVCVISY